MKFITWFKFDKPYIQRVDCGPLGQQQAGNGSQVSVRGNVERGEALVVHFVHLHLKGQSHHIKEKFDFVCSTDPLSKCSDINRSAFFYLLSYIELRDKKII
jgi:hypothetical protein